MKIIILSYYHGIKKKKKLHLFYKLTNTSTANRPAVG